MLKKGFAIKIPEPKWNSHITETILELERLRVKRLIGEIPPFIFFQLKNIFQIMENIGSARIEGNNTTLSEYVENIIEGKNDESEKLLEIKNLDDAIRFIEENTDENTKISRAYISELHKIITKKLTPPPKGEGSKLPGELRKTNVKINMSKHTPPDYSVLQDYFDELISFINNEYPVQYQLLMIAIFHHRFVWIHPFDNGNGRLVRLLTYALLIKYGFKVKTGRIINPSSVFYSNREKYYDMLSLADNLDDESLLKWADYFLSRLKNEIEKIDNLLNYEYVKNKILIPTIKMAYDSGKISKIERDLLKYIVSKREMSIKAEELKEIGIKGSVRKSRIVKRMRDKRILSPIKKGGRIYTINFTSSYLLRWVIEVLNENGFIYEFLNKSKI